MSINSKKDISSISPYTKRNLKSHSIKQATNRVEKYDKKKKKISSLPFSEEMASVMRDKLNYYDQCNGKWIDRNSMIAAPYSAELFLSTERGMPNVMLGGPRYFFHELHLQDRYPDAVSRFPYNTLANEAAKVITRLLKRNLNLKIHAAIKIQSKYRGYSIRKKASSLFHQIIMEEEKKKREEYIHHKQIVNKWYSMVSAKTNGKRLVRNTRFNLEKVRLDSTRQELIQRSIRILQRWIRMHLKLKRSSRGKLKRSNIHARRIQSFLRGSKQRKLYIAQQNSQILIAWMWRKHWRKKYGKYAIKIQRLVRSRQLIRSVILLQCAIRQFLAKLALGREQRKLIILLRTRSGVEQQAISVILEKAAAKFIIFSKTQNFKNIQSKLMLAMDYYCYKKIHHKDPTHIPKINIDENALIDNNNKDNDIDNNTLQNNALKSLSHLVQLPFYQLALSKELPNTLRTLILKIFSSHRHLKYLDGIGLTLALDYLYYKEKKGEDGQVNINKSNNDDDNNNGNNSNNGNKSNNGNNNNNNGEKTDNLNYNNSSIDFYPTFTTMKFSYDKAQLLDPDLISCNMKPTRSLLTRLIVKGHMPEKVLATAATLQIWMRFVTDSCCNAVMNHRRIFPAKYACPNCLQPFLIVRELHNHLANTCQGRETFVWMNEKTFSPLVKSFVKCIENLEHVAIIRKYEVLNSSVIEKSLEEGLAKILLDISRKEDTRI